MLNQEFAGLWSDKFLGYDGCRRRHSFSDGHDTGIYSWDLLYDYGRRQDEMWRHYLKRMEEAGASREPQAEKL